MVLICDTHQRYECDWARMPICSAAKPIFDAIADTWNDMTPKNIRKYKKIIAKTVSRICHYGCSSEKKLQSRLCF